MSQLTIDDLSRILAGCAGAGNSLDRPGGIAEVPFDVLGYDSLAIMETVAVLEQDYGVKVPDERIAELKTPGELLDLVNNTVAAG